MTSDEAQNFGKYELVSRLASGGMAVTYRARMKGAAGVTKPVVIKQILPHFAGDPEFVEMFISEARVVAGLGHGNIAQVFDFGEVNGQYFLAMELVNGQPLSKVLARARRAGLAGLPTQLALHVASQICDGLDYAHRATDEQHRPLGLVHRDVSPDNVLISWEGEVKIIDFGIAKATSAVAERTSPGTLKGKYPYFSTEQARAEPDLDARSDIFAAGVVLYEMLCGRRPYEGELHVVLPKIIHAEYDRPRAVNPALSGELEEAVLTAMAPDREDRYPTAQAFADRLRELLYSENPRFSPQLLAQLLAWLFAEDLTADGRPPDLTPSFMELVTAWKSGAPPPPTPSVRPPSTGGRRLSNPQLSAPPSRPSGPRRVVSSPGLPTQTHGPAGTQLDAAAGADDRHDTPVELPALTEAGVAVATELGTAAPQTVAQDPVTEFRTAQAREAQDRKERTQRLLMLVSVPIFAVALLLAAWHFLGRDDGPKGPPTTSVWVTSTPPGAAITLNGQPVGGVTPLIVKGVLQKDANTLGLTLPGHRPWTRRFTPQGGGSAPIHADLEPLEPAPEQAPQSDVTLAAATVTDSPPDALPEPDAEYYEVTWPTRYFTLRPRRNAVPLSDYAVASIDLNPGASYSVQTEGSVRTRPGRMGTTSTVVYFLEGDGLTADGAFGLLGRKAKSIRGAKRMHVFLLDDDASDNSGSLRVRLYQSRYVPPRHLAVSAAEHAVVPKREHRFVLGALNPQATYLLTVRNDYPTLGPGPKGQVSSVLCLESAEKTGRTNHRLFKVGERYQLSGADTLTCVFPDDRVEDNDGAIPVDIVDVTSMSREERNQTLRGASR